MPNVNQAQGLSLRDLRGHIGKLRFYYNYDPSVAADFLNAYNAVAAILANLESMSNALVVGVSGIHGDRYSPASYGSASQYANAEDKARLVYVVAPSDALNRTSLSHIDIPAPVLAIFENDQATVNPTAALVSSLTTKLITADATNGQVTTATGEIFLSFAGGQLVRRKFQRKITLWSKSSNLDEPEEG